MLLTKAKYKKIKHFLVGTWERKYYQSKLEKSTPMIYSISARVYRDMALQGRDTVNNIRTSIGFIRGKVVAEYLLKNPHKYNK